MDAFDVSVGVLGCHFVDTVIDNGNELSVCEIRGQIWRSRRGNRIVAVTQGTLELEDFLKFGRIQK